jgi:hypothetical protein
MKAELNETGGFTAEMKEEPMGKQWAEARRRRHERLRRYEADPANYRETVGGEPPPQDKALDLTGLSAAQIERKLEEEKDR